MDLCLRSGRALRNPSAAWSLGLTSTYRGSQLLLEAIERARNAGALVVAAAGNNEADNDLYPAYPASYNASSDNVLAVASSKHTDELSRFSNYGDSAVDLAAPGKDIVSTVPESGYATFSGTSMAAPHVSGAAALVLARFPGSSYTAVKSRLLGGVDYPSALSGRVRSDRLNAATALENDAVLPGNPTGFNATHRSQTGVLLTWTASGDDLKVGSAASYELRYAEAPITTGNFSAAHPDFDLPKPAPAGSVEQILLAELFPGGTYYVGLRARDNVGNPSNLVTAGPFTTLDYGCALADRVEDTPEFTRDAPWAVSGEHRYAGNFAYTDSPGANYENNTDSVSMTRRALTSLRRRR